MTRKKRRLMTLGLAALGLGTAAALALNAFSDNLVFFYSPTDLLHHQVGERTFRLGGLVEAGSVHRSDGGLQLEFKVTDRVTPTAPGNSVAVTYHGIVPDLFREGQGVVAEGHLRPDGTFVASELLAKHDEKYMPPEVHDALKRAGEQHATATLETGK